MDLVVLDSAVAGIDICRLPWGFWNIGVFIEQRGGPGAPEVGTSHHGAPRPPGAPWWVSPPRGTPQVQLRPIGFFLVQKKSPKSYAVFGLHLILISCDVKKKQTTAIGTGHWINRLVPKNDIKLL